MKTQYGKKMAKKISKDTHDKLTALGIDVEKSVAPKRFIFKPKESK